MTITNRQPLPMKIVLAFLVAALSISLIEAHAGAGAGSTMQVVNPILPGFRPDPSICRVGEDYYLVNSTFAYYPGISVFRSMDLVHWQLIGYVVDAPGMMKYDSLGVSRGIFAPAIRYSQGLFYVTCTFVDGGGNFVCTAKNPAGPWSRPVWLPEVSGIDPSMFFDDDGRAFIVFNSEAPENRPLYNGHRTIRMRSFDPTTMKVGNDERILVNGGTDIAKKPIWIEGPHLFRVNGQYYLIAAEGGTGENHSEVVFRSASIDGPFVPFAGNPILTQRDLPRNRKNPITCAGHADLVQSPKGDWWAVFLGCRPYAEGLYNTGRETFLLPVTWKDGWPTILPRGDVVPQRISVRVPVVAQMSKSIPHGNVTYTDTFSGRKLDADWQFLREPREGWYSLTERRGFLTMHLQPETCDGRLCPPLVCRRQLHAFSSATTSLSFSPRAGNEKAGLLVFQNESHFYLLCVSVDSAGQRAAELFKSTPAYQRMELLAIVGLTTNAQQKSILLRATSRGSVYDFACSVDGGKWTVVKNDVDGTFLSTKVAGGFVGCMYGLYATSMGAPTSNTAAFDWFKYSGTYATSGSSGRNAQEK